MNLSVNPTLQVSTQSTELNHLYTLVWIFNGVCAFLLCCFGKQVSMLRFSGCVCVGMLERKKQKQKN